MTFNQKMQWFGALLLVVLAIFFFSSLKAAHDRIPPVKPSPSISTSHSPTHI